jgi:hypothetical protein
VRDESGEPATLGANLWTTLEHVSEWVRFADTKAAAVLTVDGILATVLVTVFGQGQLAHRVAIYLPLGASAVLLVVSAAMCMLCLLPRLTAGPSTNFVYFIGIAAFPSAAAYFGHIRELARAGEFDRELASEIWLRSHAARTKYRYVRLSLLTLAAALAGAAAVGVAAIVLG